MAMKKAEMEEHRADYQALVSKARLAEREGLFSRAVELGLSCWDHIDGMMQYERRYEQREFSSIEAIDIVLRHSPLLLDFRNLEKLEGLLKDYRRIDKNTSVSLADRLTEARALLWDAHRLWDHIERNPGARQDKLRQVLGGDQCKWRAITEKWEKMGLLVRTSEGASYRLRLSTRMGALVKAKCPSCGTIADGPKAMFLEELDCPECRENVLFVLLPGTTTDKETE